MLIYLSVQDGGGAACSGLGTARCAQQGGVTAPAQHHQHQQLAEGEQKHRQQKEHLCFLSEELVWTRLRHPANKTHGGFSFAGATRALLRRARPSAHPSGPFKFTPNPFWPCPQWQPPFLARAALRSAIHSFCCVACHGRRQWSCAGPLPDAGQLRICLTVPRMSSLWWRWPSTSIAIILPGPAHRWSIFLSFCHPGSSGVRLTLAFGPPLLACVVSLLSLALGSMTCICSMRFMALNLPLLNDWKRKRICAQLKLGTDGISHRCFPSRMPTLRGATMPTHPLAWVVCARDPARHARRPT